MSKQYDAVLKGAGVQPDRSLAPKTFTLQRVLAAVGICAPILFAMGFVMQGFLRTDLRLGYNLIAQEVSDLTAGPLGWVQQVNFLVFGLLIIAFGVGLYRQARDEETGLGMNDQQLRDEVITLMVAGHETTSGALSWTLLLLSQHLDMEARLREEYTRVLGGRAPTIEDLPQLKLGRMVLEESMRLYPPAWAFGRQAIDEDEVGGYRIPKGAFVLMFPAVTHRHPDFWERPDVFDPERFDAERTTGRHRFAYIPFGGGPRGCIGNQFALTEAQLILATILPRYQFRLLPGAKVVPEPLITLRPRGGLQMTVHRLGEPFLPPV